MISPWAREPSAQIDLQAGAVLEEPDRAVAQQDVRAAGVYAGQPEHPRGLKRVGGDRSRAAIRVRRVRREQDVPHRVAHVGERPRLAEVRRVVRRAVGRERGGAEGQPLLEERPRRRASTSAACSASLRGDNCPGGRYPEGRDLIDDCRRRSSTRRTRSYCSTRR